MTRAHDTAAACWAVSPDFLTRTDVAEIPRRCFSFLYLQELPVSLLPALPTMFVRSFSQITAPVVDSSCLHLPLPRNHLPSLGQQQGGAICVVLPSSFPPWEDLKKTLQRSNSQAHRHGAREGHVCVMFPLRPNEDSPADQQHRQN